MLSNRIALAVVGGACVLAAGTGAYVATRQGSQPAAAARVESQVSPPAEPAQAAGDPVQETEASLEPQKDAGTPPQAESAPAAVTPEAPARAHPASPPRAERTPRTERRTRAAAGTQTARAEQQRVPAPSRPAPASEAPAPHPDRAATMPTARTEPVQPIPFPADPIDHRDREPARAAGRQFDELVVAADSVIGLQLDHTLSSETARIEDRVTARVTRDVRVDDRVAIPAGARVLGAVTVADRGGKMRERARLGVRFHTLILADGTEVPIQTDTVYREGDSPSQASAAKIGGGAIGGAIIGGILGGAKGAIIGGSTGAAGGTAAVMAGGRKPATMSAGSTMTVRVLSPVSVTVDRVQN